MASDELVLNLKIETSDSGQKLQDVNNQMDKIKKNSKETGDSFGFADTKIGKMWGGFKDGAAKAIQSMATLKGAIAATGIGLLLIAVTSLVSYFTKTERGAEKLKVMMAALGQVVNTVIDVFIKIGETLAKIGGIIAKVVTGNKSLKDGFNEAKDAIKTGGKEIGDVYTDMGNKIERAIALAERENQLRKDKRANMVEEAELEVQIAQLRELSADVMQKNTDRMEALSKAMEMQNTLYDNKIKLAREEYEQTKERNALSESTADDLDKEAELLANLIRLEAERSTSQKKMVGQYSAIQKQMVAEEKKAQDERNKLVEEERKRQEEILSIKNDAILAALDGEEKEIQALTFKYEADVREAGKDVEKKLALDERYAAEKLVIENKYLAERQKADEEAQKKIEEQRAKDLEEQKKLEEEKLKQHQKVQQMMIDGDIMLNQYKYQNGLQTFQEYLDNERELRLEAAEQEITDLEELNEVKAQINAEYDQKEFDAKQELNNQIKDAAIQVAQAGVDAIFSIQQNRLNAAKEAELANKNLTEEQKAAINKKYAEKQKKQDLAQAAANIAMSIIKVFATMGPPASFIMAGVTAAMGAIQLATIAKTKYYALGGWLRGASHEQGGIPLGGNNYAEGGEFIVNKRTMANPLMAAQVEQLNAAGNGASPPPSAPMLTADDIINGVAGAIKAIPVQVTEKSISTAQRNVEVRENRFTVV